jgi:hypothetical protein
VIVLDEHLGAELVYRPLQERYPGAVIFLHELRPRTVIKDEAIRSLLLTRKNPVFVTINSSDFWRKIEPHPRYWVVCFPFPIERQNEIPDLLLRLLRHREFGTTGKRIGKIIRVTEREIQFYGRSEPSPKKVGWT